MSRTAHSSVAMVAQVRPPPWLPAKSDFSCDGHRPNILPISGGKLKPTTNGIRCLGVAFVGITASNALLVT
jgi:hypothetical protein